MASFLAKRFAINLAMLAMLVIVVGLLLRVVPVNPIQIMAENSGTGGIPFSNAARAHLRVELGLTGTPVDQVIHYINGLLHGNLGISLLASRQPVSQIIFQHVGATIELGLAAFIIGLVIALPVGIYGALRRGGVGDTAGTTFMLVGLSTPTFLLGIVLIYVFAVRLNLLPIYGRNGSVFQAIFTGNPQELGTSLRYLCLPAIALGLPLAAVTARLVRSSLLEALRQDYVRFARAKGMPGRVVLRHALRNSLIPVVTVLGIQLGFLLAGAVLVENVFAWPGIGKQLITSLNAFDYPTIQGIVLLAGAFFLLVNMLVEVLYVIIDPRIKLS